MMQHQEGQMPFRDGHTWYRVTGAGQTGKPPVVVLHGGPGATHDYLDRFALLAADGRAVVHYDQFGCGRSTHRPDWPAHSWTVALFLEELQALLAHLGMSGAYHLLGQSWGGMLAAEHAVLRPAGLHALIIANSPASMLTWVAEANRLRAALPPEVEATLLRHEQAGTTADPAYAEAVMVFYARHLCRISPFPADVQASMTALEANPTVYMAMNGPSEFHVVGSLKNWTIEDRLPQITAPTLVLSGRHDEATDACVRPYAERIAGAERIVFEQSSHMPHVEETEATMAAVSAFLARHDAVSAP